MGLTAKRISEGLNWEAAQAALLNSLKQMLRPMVRLMLRNGITFQAFSEIAKSVFVEIAEQSDVTGPFKATKSRVALLTGLTRPEVKRIMDRGEALPELIRHSRIPAILGGWCTDPLFLDESGMPMALPATGSGRSFETLVRRFGADVPKATVLDELLLGGNVEWKDNKLLLVNRHYRCIGDPARYRYIGDAYRRFGGTITHNVLSDEAPFLQRETWSRAIPAERLQEVRESIRNLLGRQLDEAIDLLDKKEQLPALPHHRTTGVGYYYFET